MTQTVYADLLFLINFSMDYLCLYICTGIMRRKRKLSKMIIASAIGGLYSIISIFLPAAIFISLIIDALVSVLMCAIVFAQKERKLSSTLLCTFLFVGISMMTGGCMTAIFNLLNRLDLPLEGIEEDGISAYMFAILAAVAGFISIRSGDLISRHSTAKECKLTIRYNDRELSLVALSDSGNLVKDPISGKYVIIIDRQEMSKLTDLSIFDSYTAGIVPDTPAASGLRLIPINTAGGRGLLCAAIPQKLSVEFTTKKNKMFKNDLDALIAPTDIGRSAKGCAAIVPAELLKDL